MIKTKLIRQIILFASGLALFYFVFNAILTAGVLKSRLAQLGKVNRICGHDKEPELAVFGSSVGEVGISTPLLQQSTGLSSYNFSIDGTRFEQYEGLIDELTRNNNKTKLVLFSETYFSFWKTDSLNELERYLANLSNENVYKSLHAIQPDLVWKCRYIPFYKYITASSYFYLSAFDGWRRFFGKKDADTLLGYTPVHRNWIADVDAKLKLRKPFKIQVDSSVIRDYTNCIKRLQSKGIRVVILLQPIYSVIVKTKTDILPLREALLNVSKQTGCLFWDYTNNYLCEDKSFFYNATHLNDKGAMLYSNMLADRINGIMNNVAGSSDRQ